MLLTPFRFIDQVTGGVDFVFAYIKDILIINRHEEDHANHLRQLLERLPCHDR